MPEDNDKVPPSLSVQDFTRAAEPLLRFLNALHKDGAPEEPDEVRGDDPLPAGYEYPTRLNALPISDVKDELGRRCVDLVQEGGGVHGIALAGYTYVLEKMGIAFVKTAGTSAGAINAMLLNATLSRDELARLCDQSDAKEPDKCTKVSERFFKPKDLDRANYYSTRSEKLLSYLAAENLANLVDGHPMWQKLLRSTFRGRVKLENVKREKNRWIGWGAVLGGGLFIAMIGLLGIVLGGYSKAWPVMGVVGLLLFALSAGRLAVRAWQGRMLWAVAEKLGANPGDYFQNWITRLLKENSIPNVTALWNKLARESECFKPQYDACPLPEQTTFTKRPANDQMEKRQKQFFDLIKTLEARVTALEGNPLPEELVGIAGASTKAEIIEEVWEKLMDVARELPWGYDPDDSAAMDWQAGYMMPVFQRVLELQDVSCGYNDYRKKGPYTNEITLVAADITNEMKVEFPAMHRMYWGSNYNISPATYVRASMSVPFFFKPLRVHHDTKNAQLMREMEDAWHYNMRVRRRISHTETVFVDGGLLSNFPVNIYHSPDMPLSRKPTLGVRLEFENEWLTNEVNNVLGEAGTLVSTMRFFYDRDFLSKNDLYKLTVRSIDTGQVHWLNFGLTPSEQMELFFRGALAATFFLAAGHPDYLREKATRDEQLKGLGHTVWAGAGNPRIDIHAGGQAFGHEDYGDTSVVFDWHQYKKERIMAMARARQQRRWLKSFPNEQ